MAKTATEQDPTPDDRPWDVVVIGAGAAGLAAATLLGRCRRRVAVVGGRTRANTASESVHHLPYAEGVSPDDLYSAMERELGRYDIPLLRETALSIVSNQDTHQFDVRTESRRIPAERLVLANGLKYEVPSWVPDKAWGKRVFTCPFCHASEYQGEPFVAVGTGAGTLEMALLCAVHAGSLTVVVAEPETVDDAAADQIRSLGGTVVHDSIRSAAYHATGGLDLVTAKGTTYHAGAVLLVGIMRLRTDLTSQLGLRTNENGLPEVDAEGRSSHPRVWLAGTAAQPHLMLSESIGGGVRAGISVHKDLCQVGRAVSG
jgi:thioredoxin reductase (NADPH)